MRINVRRVAAVELREAVAWYDLQQQGLGSELVREIDQLFKGIAEHPERWPVYHRNVRRAVVGRFPYVIYYERLQDFVRVYRIVHASRDPAPVRKLLP